MTMHLAVSFVRRAEVQIARHTSQLHRTARATSCNAGAFILAAATVTMSGSLPPMPSKAGPPPPATNNAANSAQPSRLPAQEPLQHFASSGIPMQIGRASCRERGKNAVGDGSSERKNRADEAM